MFSNESGSFELTFLGCAGGPLNDHTQSFLLKQAGCDAPGYICIDAGSGLSEIADMIYNTGESGSGVVKSLYRNRTEDVSTLVAPGISCKSGFGTLSKRFAEKTDNRGSNVIERAYEIYGEITEYFITHPHLDHLVGLILNSPAIYERPGCYKKIYGTEQTVTAIRENLFNDKIWPDFTADRAIRLKSLDCFKAMKLSTIKDIECIPFTLRHGYSVRNTDPVFSTAYLFRDCTTNDHILIFGDTESDEVSKSDSLMKIWEHLSKNVPIRNLKAIVIECSNPEEVETEKLYGHMSPRFIIWELLRLVQFYGAGDSMDPSEFELHVILTHIKDGFTDEDPRTKVLRQLRNLYQKSELNKFNIDFSIAVPGFTLTL
ncbi:low-affinity cyclic AMP phosphodiesterase [Kluyveromyces marxianus]|uniref:Low-affinity cyclic AMP phosphodiesterase n=1 Tax=Kluyveromyces marxianus TaxID=4911 RepID=A0ABX6EY91_KLUMA|nr:low-affinity cyclic AMP phosphodiesterase [Kluyveromyces marxianus]